MFFPIFTYKPQLFEIKMCIILRLSLPQKEGKTEVGRINGFQSELLSIFCHLGGNILFKITIYSRVVWFLFKRGLCLLLESKPCEYE